MLKRFKLGTQIVGTVVFLLACIVSVSGFSLKVLYDLEDLIHEMGNEDIPLVRVMAQSTEQLLGQQTRFGAILQYAKIHNQDKFEQGEKAFKEYGQRFTDIIQEGQAIAQEGINIAHTKAEKDEFRNILNLLKKIEAEHDQFEHHGEEMIHVLHTISFGDVRGGLKGQDGTGTVTAAGHGGPGNHASEPRTILYGSDHESEPASGEGHGSSHASGPDVNTAQKGTLTRSIERMDHETETLMEELETALELIDELTKTLIREAEEKQKLALEILIPLILFSTIGGLFLGITISTLTVNAVKKAVQDMKDGANDVTVASEQVSQASNMLAESVSVQASSLEESTTVLNDIARRAEDNSRGTHEVNGIIGQTTEIVDKTGETISRLRGQSQQAIQGGDSVSQSLKNLSDIVMQINMLATSATAETKRGDASSLAVFTKEIKEFAQSGFDLAKSVASEVGMVMDKARESYLLAQASENSFKEIGSLTHQMKDRIANIDQASNEQAQGIKELEIAIQTLNESTHTNAASAEEGSAASQAMADQALIMMGVVDTLSEMVQGVSNKKPKVPLGEEEEPGEG